MDNFANAVAEFQARMNEDVERWKAEYMGAAELVATLYETVTGNTGEPKRGVVEDVQDVIAALTAERDLFKKETVALAKDATRYKEALDRIIVAGCMTSPRLH